MYVKFLAQKWLQGCMLPGELKWHMNGPVTMGVDAKSAA